MFLGDTQRIVFAGHGARCVETRHVLYEIPSAATGRELVRCLADPEFQPRVTWLDDERPGGPEPVARAALGFTFAGLRACGVDARHLAGFPCEFREGPASRACIVGDVGWDAPKHWLWPFGGDDAERIHMVVTTSATAANIETVECALAKLAERVGFTALRTLGGALRLDGTEPFGFRDPVNQPHFVRDHVWYGAPDPAQPVRDRHDPAGLVAYRGKRERWAEPGEFVLGEPGDLGDGARRWHVPGTDGCEPTRVGYHGTFGALRVMAQDVRRAGDIGDVAMARMVGSNKDGMPLDECPVESHVRRANPLRPESPGVIVNKAQTPRWLLRRGVPYHGIAPHDEDPPGMWRPGGVGLGDEQGLLGLFLCASLANQYEGVLGEWINNGLHDPSIAGTNDRVVGHCDADGDARRLVTTRGVAYVFYPARAALARIAVGW